MEIRTSVRTLVEFILRSGDIDNSKTTSKDAMLEGGRIHRMIQRRMGADYHAEVPLRHIIDTPNYKIVIDGRADGIIISPNKDVVIKPAEIEVKKDDEGGSYTLIVPETADDADNKKNKITDVSECVTVTIDEIKGTYRDIHKMQEPEIVHLAQAKCYAYIFALQNSLKGVRVRMTYCHLETEELRYFHYDYTFMELSEWFLSLMTEYRKWADFEYEWKKKRQQSVKALEFPFEYRKGQKELVTYVYQTIYHQRKLFIEAPTGVGKTMATVFPALKAMGENMSEKIFYLTAKTITREAPEHALSILRKQELFLKSVTLTAKDKICFLDESDCNPISCSYAKGHYDRVNEALFDILTNVDNLTREEILKYSVKYQVCPFELSLDIALFADMVICDYNYVFDPHAYLRRFFTEGVRQDYVFLTDEAHNLVERGRKMYSADIIKEEILGLKKTAKEHSVKITHALEGCNKEMLLLKRDCDTYKLLSEEDISPLIRKLLRLYTVIEDYLDEHEKSPIRKELLSFWFKLSHFLLMYDNLDSDYVIYSEHNEENEFVLKLFNVNPARNLKNCMSRGRASILFSATLLPIEYYKRLLGAEDGDYEVYAESVFDPEKRGLFIANDVTSRYKRRNYFEYLNIAIHIKSVVSARTGNYMVFFPSFAFMKAVSDIYIEEYGDEGLLIQGASMKEAEREEFLSYFKEKNDETLIGMCVLGGIFSEGIDLKHDSLIGALIVGTGIPMVCSEREILKKYFDIEGESGYDYAYKYPGMNKVMQAAGRVIRTSKDTGVVALLDERFTERGYLRMFPREWSNYEIASKNEISDRVFEFWENVTSL